MAKGVWRPRSERMPRDEYLIRAREFAHRRAAKLTPDQVASIRENRQGLTDKQQAALYGVHRNTIYKVRHGATYTGINHVTTTVSTY